MPVSPQRLMWDIQLKRRLSTGFRVVASGRDEHCRPTQRDGEKQQIYFHSDWSVHKMGCCRAHADEVSKWGVCSFNIQNVFVWNGAENNFSTRERICQSGKFPFWIHDKDVVWFCITYLTRQRLLHPPPFFFLMPQLNNRLFDELNVRNLVSNRWHSQTSEQVSVGWIWKSVFDSWRKCLKFRWWL